MSGAYLTRGPYGGLVRGCRACKMPLAADMSCPRCGPNRTWPTLVLDVGRACEHCGYHVHAKTCPTLDKRDRKASEVWEYNRGGGSWTHEPTNSLVEKNVDGSYSWWSSTRYDNGRCATLVEACAAALKADGERAARDAEEQRGSQWQYDADCVCSLCDATRAAATARFLGVEEPASSGE